MKTRILSAIIALPIVIFPLYLGGWLTSVLILVAISIGLWEFNRAFKMEEGFIYFLQLLLTLGLFILQYSRRLEYILISLVLMIILSFIYYIIRYPKVELQTVFIGLIGYFYISVMMSHIVLVRNMDQYGHILIWLILLISFGSDTFAYFTGVFLGKHKLAPKLSPNKTIEGAIGGILGSGILTTLYTFFLAYTETNIELHHFIGFALMGIVGSIFGQFGDMTASAMKRVTKIKDFGTLIPGHGGIVDRMDSIIFVAPFVYYASMLILSL